MWDGGNVAHYAREQPRVLIDGNPRRAPWIDVGDLRSKGAVVVWTCGENARNSCFGDPAVMPISLRTIAGDALVQPPFTLPFRQGDMVLVVGWAIMPPAPAFASTDCRHAQKEAKLRTGRPLASAIPVVFAIAMDPAGARAPSTGR
jgi:hypothetical protein